MPETCLVNENTHLYLWHLVGSLLSYINDARSHELKDKTCLYRNWSQRYRLRVI